MLYILATLLILTACGIVRDVNAIAYKIPLGYARSQDYSSEWVKSNDLNGDSSAKLEDGLLGNSGQGYYIAVNIGKPSQTLNVLIDTGSSNFAVAAFPDPLIAKYFHRNRSETLNTSGIQVSVPYTQGFWEGELGKDIISLNDAPDLSVQADIALISKADNFFINGSNWQGIFGLAYRAIVRPDSTVNPFWDSLIQAKLSSDVFSLQLCRRSDGDGNSGGMMTIGGIDPKLYTGDITDTPLWREWYYEVVMTALYVGDIPVPVNCKELNADKTIVDSGTTNLRLPYNVFTHVVELLQRALTANAKDGDAPIPDNFWKGESVLCWLKQEIPWRRFPSLRISLLHSWNSTFTLVVHSQQYLQEVSKKYDPALGSHHCHKFAINPSNTGAVLGANIMEGFYTVFDRQNKRVGFAKSTCDMWAPCCPQPIIIGPLPARDPIQCAYVSPDSNGEHALAIVAYVTAGLCALCTVPLVIMLMQWVWSLLHQRQRSGCSDTASLVGED